ncbi:MAG: cytochrome c3 family protein [Gammaproteobacteria bacterium]|nr:cytochrome c3 family protein [Gammaproteobacteria bacterium]
MNNSRYHTNLSTWIIVLVTLWLTLSIGYAKAESNNCENCHKDAKFFVENRKVHQYYQDWLTSPHKAAGLACNDCHGGDPQSKEADSAHQGVFSTSDSRSRVFYQQQPQTCGECHAVETELFEQSDHYQGLLDHADAPTCSTCHRAMNRRPYYQDLIENTCRTCHYENNEDDLPLVADRAEQILHRMNVSKGYLNWSSLYFRSNDWPNDSKTTIDALETEFHDILAVVHRFNLRRSDRASVELLTKLKLLYQQVLEHGDDAAQ